VRRPDETVRRVVTNEPATTREISWPTVIVLVTMVAGMVALSLFLRRHEQLAEMERNVACAPHSSGAAAHGDEPSHCDD
jgi:uncharacterized membrane protein